MVLPGHLAGGFLATEALLYLSHAPLSTHEAVALSIVGTLAGEGPDLDLLWFSFRHLALGKADSDNHRNYPSHAPALWLLGSVAVAAAGALAGSLFMEFVGWAILAGSWSHFVLDSIEYGVMWLWPFSKKRFCLRQVPEAEVPGERGSARWYWNVIARVYVKRVTMYAEVAITLVALYFLPH